MTFYEIAQAQFLSVKFDNVVSTFFVNQLDQKLSLIQNLLGLWHSYIEPQLIWTSPWLYWKWLFMKLHKHSFWAWNWQLSKYFFVNHLDQKLSLIQNLLELRHSYIDPQFIWTSPWLYWKWLFWICTSTVFEREIWQRIKFFFRKPPRSKIITHLEPTRVMTILHRTSIHLNKSLTILKMTFYEIAQAQFLSGKFDNVVSTFFVNHLDQKLSLIQNLLGLWQSYIEPQFIWTSPWPYWKWLFMKLRKHRFEREIGQRSKYFFRKPPRSKTITHSEPTRVMTLLDRTSIHLNKSLTILKMTFYEIAQAQFLSVKFDNAVSTFFVNHLDQKLSLIQNLLGLWHSYIEPQFIWTSPWPYWKWLFMKLRKHSFWAWNLTT